jgi:hypothetical protein
MAWADGYGRALLHLTGDRTASAPCVEHDQKSVGALELNPGGLLIKVKFARAELPANALQANR